MSKLSKLFEYVLDEARKPKVPIEDDIEALTNYIELERIRTPFDFDIEIEESVENQEDEVMIPPLILQPFVENSIWHGLHTKVGARKLDINIRIENEALVCTITDNGIGRSDHKSLRQRASRGLLLVDERLALLSETEKDKRIF